MSAIQYERALTLLEAPEKYPGLAPRKGFALLRIWVYPSFKPCAAWSILQSGKSHFVRRVVWEQARTVGAQPITYGAESPIAEEGFSTLLAELRAMQLSPFAVASTAGIDGTTYGVEVGGSGKSGLMSWWGKPPAGWAALQAWHVRAIGRLESLLPSSTCELPPFE
jgi:hypothetical protein